MTGQRMVPGGAAESSAGALADTCGTELSGNRVNESYREGKRRGYSSFNIPPPSSSVGPALVCSPLGEAETGRSVGGISEPVKRISNNRS